MSLIDWLTETTSRIKKDGIDGIRESGYRFYLGAARKVTGILSNSGDHVYNEEWDLLIILDGCRYDTLNRLSDEYSFINSVEERISVGTWSGEWIENTFTGGIPKTKYITGNPFSEEFLSCSNVDVDEVWKYEWSDEHGTVLPDPLTDRAIDSRRSESYPRTVVHYMQPHHPFVNSDVKGDHEIEKVGSADQIENDIWDSLRKGDTSVEEVLDGYEDNLRFVLDNISQLIDNTTGRVVITADHGNAFGEKGFYGHPMGVYTKAVRQVPWCVINAEDSGRHNPDVDDNDKSVSEDVEQKLESLGYR